MNRRLTVVAYAVNGSGLGHLTRVLAILRWIKRLGWLAGVRPEIYVLTSSESSGLAMEEGIAAFKIPSKTAIQHAQIPKENYLRLARQWVWHSLGLLRPDLLLVDTFPGGSFGELLHALDGPGSRVFIHRAVKAEFAAQETMQALLPLYNRILIPAEPGVTTQALTPELQARACQLGPIMLRSREELHARAEARCRLGVPEDKLAVWLSAGGGGDPKAARTLEVLIETLRPNPALHLVIGAGPLYRGAPVRGANITWITGHQAAMDYLGLDLAFSAAGFNSFYELLHAGVPTAFYAQEKIADEQSRRVATAQQATCALAVTCDAEGIPLPHAIQHALQWLQDATRREALATAARQFVPNNFARQAAFESLVTCVPKTALEEAMELGTPELFLALEKHGVGLDTVLPILHETGLRSWLDGSEQHDLLQRLFQTNGFPAETTGRLFRGFVRLAVPPQNAYEAEVLADAAIDVVKGFGPFMDERGALAFLRLLSPDRTTTPEQLAQSLGRYLTALSNQHESLWSGMALLSQQQSNNGNERNLPAALLAATAELEQRR